VQGLFDKSNLNSCVMLSLWNKCQELIFCNIYKISRHSI